MFLLCLCTCKHFGNRYVLWVFSWTALWFRLKLDHIRFLVNRQHLRLTAHQHFKHHLELRLVVNKLSCVELLEELLFTLLEESTQLCLQTDFNYFKFKSNLYLAWMPLNAALQHANTLNGHRKLYRTSRTEKLYLYLDFIFELEAATNWSTFWIGFAHVSLSLTSRHELSTAFSKRTKPIWCQSQLFESRNNTI